MKPKNIQKLLIANRGEVVPRIIATAHEMGIKTVAMYTIEDQSMPYLSMVDGAYQLSKSGVTGYLDQENIIAIAHTSGAQAIHPGYGFLAENSSFAQKVINAGLVWIGPSPENIAQMGNKSDARTHMLKVGIPIVPGKENIKNVEEAKAVAQDIGYPIMLKAALGGGGKAMRIVQSSNELTQAWDRVLSESEKLFGSSLVLIEKYIEHARHIEVQVAGDGKNVVHLFERECSIQRRNQKVIEEAPCMFIEQATQTKLYEAACKAAQSINYDSIGTIEFIVTPNEKFYFLEMNTRLQVEHPVTEMICGIDLIRLQIELALSGILSIKQNDISRRGHAIESRINAEDELFQGTCGTIDYLSLPTQPGTRVDHALYQAQTITPFFDNMLAKLIVWAPNRSQAIKRMNQALEQLFISGIVVNKHLHQKVVLSDEFKIGQFHTQWLMPWTKSQIKQQLSSNTQKIAIIAAILAQAVDTSQNKDSHHTSPVINKWRRLGWR